MKWYNIFSILLEAFLTLIGILCILGLGIGFGILIGGSINESIFE